ncbi:hypothetical protein L1887_53974 [Cichorium endivia]|nr:hypothetical protein L1887_53974 [Cichorium endivia]
MRVGCSRVSRGGPPVASRQCGYDVTRGRSARPKHLNGNFPAKLTDASLFLWILGPLSVVTFGIQPCDFVTLDFVVRVLLLCCCCACASAPWSPRLGLQMVASAMLVPVTGLFVHSIVPSDHNHHYGRGILILVVDLLSSLHAPSTLGPSLFAKIRPTLLLVRRW